MPYHSVKFHDEDLLWNFAVKFEIKFIKFNQAMLFYKQSASPLTCSDLGGVWAADLLAVASRSKVKGRFTSITPSEEEFKPYQEKHKLVCSVAISRIVGAGKPLKQKALSFSVDLQPKPKINCPTKKVGWHCCLQNNRGILLNKI